MPDGECCHCACGCPSEDGLCYCIEQNCTCMTESVDQRPADPDPQEQP